VRLTVGGPRDRGSGTVLGLALVAVLLVMTLAVVGLARAVHARSTAQTAADLGALAAATALHRAGGPSADPCGVAAEVVAANDARLTACRAAGGEVEVTALATVGGGEGSGLVARATARAGPA
jgi:secretion/DNA translocation related TadE-like protein